MTKRVFKFLFYMHLSLISVLIISLTLYALISSSHTHHYFHPLKWYLPLLSSTLCAGIVGLTWQWITSFHPSKAIKAAFWLSPLLTFAIGIMFVYIDSALSLTSAVVALLSALIQSLYGCWVSPRFEYATKILSISIAFPPPAKTRALAFSLLLTGIIFCSFIAAGIGFARAIESKTKLSPLFILLISLGWTMHFLKNVLIVTVSRIKYMYFACGVEIDTRVAFHDTIKYLTGSVSMGSVLVPMIGLFRGFARSMSLVGGHKDEFMFSCVSCYMGIASALVMCGNRWGFVYVGVYNKGFVQASSDTWEMFNRVGLEQLIDSDLTGSFCFLCGVTGGAISGLVSGIWTIVIHKNYASQVSIYAFFIGYFMCRLAMAWPQACVSAYYVAYAENPNRFDSTIPVRLQQLQRSLALA